MNSLGKREKVLIGCLVGVIGFYLYYSLFLNCYLKKIEAAKEMVEQCTSLAEEVKNTKEAIVTQREELKGLKIVHEKYFDAIPNMERNPEIVYNLKKLGDISRVKILTLSLGKPSEYKAEIKDNAPKAGESVNKIYNVPVSMSVLGDYNTIISFLQSIENDKRIAEIKGLDINTDSRSGGLNLSLAMNYYYIDGITQETLNYDFNDGSYGKSELFK